MVGEAFFPGSSEMLKGMISFIAGTLIGALFSALGFGIGGMLVGSVAGAIIGWWGAKRLMP
jgi:hypothetical protein